MLLPTSSALNREKLNGEQLQLLSRQFFPVQGWGDCPKPGSPLAAGPKLRPPGARLCPCP